jgi:hypothetical protein
VVATVDVDFGRPWEQQTRHLGLKSQGASSGLYFVAPPVLSGAHDRCEMGDCDSQLTQM